MNTCLSCLSRKGQVRGRIRLSVSTCLGWRSSWGPAAPATYPLSCWPVQLLDIAKDEKKIAPYFLVDHSPRTSTPVALAIPLSSSSVPQSHCTTCPHLYDFWPFLDRPAEGSGRASVPLLFIVDSLRPVSHEESSEDTRLLTRKTRIW